MSCDAMEIEHIPLKGDSGLKALQDEFGGVSHAKIYMNIRQSGSCASVHIVFGLPEIVVRRICWEHDMLILSVNGQTRLGCGFTRFPA